MKCPQCQNPDTRVIDTRLQKDNGVRRRRECSLCKIRFTTIETRIQQHPYIVKKDGRREPFDREKLRRGLQLACLKRPVSLAEIEHIVSRIERQILDRQDHEIEAIDVGHSVMSELKTLDDVAYVRFASVYRHFEDVNEFVEALKDPHRPAHKE